MSPINVLVYDDEADIADSLAEKIRSAYDDVDVTSGDQNDFQRLMNLVNHRRTAWRKGETVDDAHPVDDAHVVVVDYDLLGYSDSTDTTGSRLAYLLRCFSRCGFIIILNEFGSNVFDLSLGSPSQDFADLHVGDMQIGNPGLWRSPFEGYRPWYWPIVPDARENFERCVDDVRKNMDTPIMAFLGLDRVIDWIPQQARRFIDGGQRIEEVTFKNFVESSHGGKDSKDKLDAEQIARVAAARIVSLLNSVILPEQSALIDAPHLVSRFPSLISNGHSDYSSLNRLCNLVDPGIDDLLAKNLRKHKFQKSHWLWRPAWYWTEINKDEEIEEVKDPWATEEVDWVFCEDVSQFLPFEHAQDFRAIVSPPFIKRFVLSRDSPDVHRYVRQIGDGTSLDPSRVDYIPQAAFSM